VLCEDEISCRAGVSLANRIGRARFSAGTRQAAGLPILISPQVSARQVHAIPHGRNPLPTLRTTWIFRPAPPVATQTVVGVAIDGLDGSLESFREQHEAIVSYLTSVGRADRLDQDLRHEPYDNSGLSGFVRFYCCKELPYVGLTVAGRGAQRNVDADGPPSYPGSARVAGPWAAAR
jgi:hypothetical protein